MNENPTNDSAPVDPKTAAEWQEAVDGAAAASAIADCKMYGLLTGWTSINVARCDDILARGRALGVLPSAPVTQLAIAMVEQVNATRAGSTAPEHGDKETPRGTN